MYMWCMYVRMHVCTYLGMSVCLSVCLYVCMSVCLYVCMSVWLYVCMSVCLYVCVSVCMSVCLVCMYVCLYVCMHACMYVCEYVCMSVCLHVCMYVCMYACMYVCVYTHMYYNYNIYVRNVFTLHQHVGTWNCFPISMCSLRITGWGFDQAQFGTNKQTWQSHLEYENISTNPGIKATKASYHLQNHLANVRSNTVWSHSNM